jgi:nitric oxide reductase activation protein
MSGSRERHDKLMWAISLPDDGFPNDIDRSVTDSEEAMISASRNGVEFLVVNLTWQPIDEVNGNGDKH